MDQCELFGEPLPPPEPQQVIELPLPPLAAPCGFRNRSNTACQRLARDPTRLDGRKLRSHGRPLLAADGMRWRLIGDVTTEHLAGTSVTVETDAAFYGAMKYQR